MPKYLDYHGLETLKGDIDATYLNKNKRGVANGVASLDSSGKVPTSQISGAITDYDNLTDKPSINGTTLSGNKTAASLGIFSIPSGGTAGQVLSKTSGTDYAVEWSTPAEPASPDDIVVVSDSTPTDPDARIWFPETAPQSVQLPTYAEHEAVLDDIAPDYSDLTFPVAAGQGCIHQNARYKAKQNIQTSEEWTAAHWEAESVEDSLSDLKSEVRSNPRIVETLENTADLYISDADGYVVAQFSDGHIKTQNFDSSDIGDLDDLETTDDSSIVDAINEVNSKTIKNVSTVEPTDGTANLDIVDNSGYVIARFADGHIQTKNFNSNKVTYLPVEYKFSGTNLMIGYGYNATYDAVIVVNCGRANDLFDFSMFALKAKGTSLENLSTTDLIGVWLSSTDMHGPFQFYATTDPDGYYSSSTSPSFTGGNHKVEINGSNVKSASSKYVHYFADGVPVSSGYGRCNNFEIKWANNIQAYNCVKADGTGRTSLVEYHDMIFDGVEFKEDILLVPSEEIVVKLWYGLQSVSWGTTYTSVRFEDAINRGIYTTTDNDIKSGNNVTSGIVEIGTNHTLRMRVDPTYDLGKRTYYTGDKGAFISNSKAYFNIINATSVTMTANTGYGLRGSYRFYPTVS